MKNLYPFQEEGVRAVVSFLDRSPGVLLADEMGCGKTVQAVRVAEGLDALKVLVVCPLAVRHTWAAEFEESDIAWHVRVYRKGEKFSFSPDSRSEVLIVHYDVLHKVMNDLRSETPDLTILDECQKVKNPQARRTRLLIGNTYSGYGAFRSRKWLCLSGTPILKSPIDLWPVLRLCSPADIGSSYFRFTQRYCGAHQMSYGGRSFYDVSGATNLKELESRLRSSIMVRRTKEQVLPELPPLIRSVDVLEADRTAQSTLKKEAAWVKKIIGHECPELHEWAKLSRFVSGGAQTEKPDISSFSEIRQKLGVCKVPSVLEMLETALENTEKVIVWTHHHAVSDAIMAGVKVPAVLVDGRKSATERERDIFAFQNDPACRVLVGSISAAGAGITLTAAQLAIFAELDWVPANIDQAEARHHRIGTTHSSVQVWYPVFRGSMDELFLSTIGRKARHIRAALDSSQVTND